MRKRVLIIVSILIVGNCFGQAPSWALAKLFGGTNAQMARAMKTDQSGNSYVAGIFYDSIDIGTHHFVSRGDNDIFIFKIDPCGKIMWANMAGGKHWDGALDIAIDRFGNSYITGYISDTAYFGTNIAVAPANQGNAFVAKYDDFGNNVWVRNSVGGATYQVYGLSVAADDFGNVYFCGDVMGAVTSTLSFDSITLVNSGFDKAVFMGKYDANGNIIWAKNYGTISIGVSDLGMWTITVDHSGNIYSAGNFSNQISFVFLNNILVVIAFEKNDQIFNID